MGTSRVDISTSNAAIGRQSGSDLPAWFIRDVLNSDRPVVVVFGNATCPACIHIQKEMVDVKTRHSDKKFIYVDVDKEPQVFQRYSQSYAVPFVAMFDKGKLVASHLGSDSFGYVLDPDKRAAEGSAKKDSIDELLKPAPHSQGGLRISETFADDVNEALSEAGGKTSDIRLLAGERFYIVLDGEREEGRYTDTSKAIEALNNLIAGRQPNRTPLFREVSFWGEEAWLVDIDGVYEGRGQPESEYLILTSSHNSNAWVFDYESSLFQERAAREAGRIIDQFDFLLSLPNEALKVVQAGITSDSRYPLREKLASYKIGLQGYLSNVPKNIFDIHRLTSFADSAWGETLKLAYRISYRYQNQQIFDLDTSPQNFAKLLHTKVAASIEAEAIDFDGKRFDHPASFCLALTRGEDLEMNWNLQLLSEWLRFMVLRGFDVSFVKDEIRVSYKDEHSMTFSLRGQLIVERYVSSSNGEWKEKVVGSVINAKAVVTHSPDRPYALATFILPDGKRLPPMKIMSVIPQQGSRDKHPTSVEKQANENAARWLEGLVINLADWKQQAKPTHAEGKKKGQKVSNVATLPKEDGETGVFEQQIERQTVEWIKKLLEDMQWGEYEVSLLVSTEKNLAAGLTSLLGRRHTRNEIYTLLYNDMGLGVAGRWGDFKTKEGTKSILWVKIPTVIPHETGHDFFGRYGVENLVDNQWHTTSLLFPREEDFLGYAGLVQDYFATARDFYFRGGSGQIPSEDGGLTAIGVGNLGAAITSIHGGLSLVFPSSYALWGDIEPFAKKTVRLEGQEYSAELWESEMNKSTLAGVVYYATDPHEVGAAERHLAVYHQMALQMRGDQPLANPFTEDSMLEGGIPMDELRIYQTRVEVLKSDDPAEAKSQRMKTLVHYAPDILRNGLKSVKAMRLCPPQVVVFDAQPKDTDESKLDVSGFLLTSEQERLLRSQNYKNFYAGISFAEGEVAVTCTGPGCDKADGQAAGAEFNRGSVMAHSGWVGGNTYGPSLSSVPPEPPVQQIVEDKRPEMPENWSPFKEERKALWVEKENLKLEEAKLKGTLPQDGAPKEEAAKGAGPSPLLALAAPLYPIYAFFKGAGRVFGAISEGGASTPQMSASDVLCIDGDRTAQTFAIDPEFYESIKPVLTDYELLYRYDPQEALGFLRRLSEQGIDPEYILDCLIFPLGESLLSQNSFETALNLYSWAREIDTDKRRATSIQEGLYKLADKILNEGDLRHRKDGWDALRQANELGARQSKHISLTVDYLMWFEGASLQPAALYHAMPDITVQERELAAEAIMNWTLSTDPAIQIAALRNAWSWLDKPSQFVHTIFQKWRKGFIQESLIARFLDAIEASDADEFVNYWFREVKAKEEFMPGLNWLRNLKSASVRTIATALITGLDYDDARPMIKEIVEHLRQPEKEELTGYLDRAVIWEEGREKESFKMARALVRYFPELAAGYKHLVTGFLKDAWPADSVPSGGAPYSAAHFLSALGIESFHDVPELSEKMSEWIWSSIVSFPNAGRLRDFYKILYDEAVPSLVNVYQWVALLDYLGLTYNEDLATQPMRSEVAKAGFSKDDFLILILRCIEKRYHWYEHEYEERGLEGRWTNLITIAGTLHNPWDETYPRAYVEKTDKDMMEKLSGLMSAYVLNHDHCIDARVKASLVSLLLKPQDAKTREEAVRIFRDSGWSLEQWLQHGEFLNLPRTELMELLGPHNSTLITRSFLPLKGSNLNLTDK